MLAEDETISKLCKAEVVCVDIETKDPGLVDYGPGTHRGEGYICGVGLGAEIEGELVSCYLDVRHPDTDESTRKRNKAAIAEVLSSPSAKLGANIVYDLEWLTHEGFNVNMSALHDVQYAEPLLNEYRRSYSLSSLAKEHTEEEKKTNVLEDYNSMMNWKGKAISNLWKMPAEVVEEYALADVDLPLKIFKKQYRALEREGLTDIYKLETELIPSLLKMRKNGVKIDEKKFSTAVRTFTERRWALQKELSEWAGYEVNLNSPIQLAKLFDRDGIPYPRRPPTDRMKREGKQGNPRMDKLALNKLTSKYPVCDKILEYRHVDTIISMFLHPYLKMLVEGRLYGTFHPLKSDDYGTVAGRFSASKPNLQQVSAIDEEGDDEDAKGQVLRQLFIPEEDCEWAKLDYSQIEYRIMAHYAEGSPAENLRRRYVEDPKTDLHQVICDSTGFDRRTAKRLNFGGAYGMGVKTASETFGWTMDEAEEFMAGYHRAAPYVKRLRNTVSEVAARRGHVFTILGRKARTHPSRKLHSMFNRLIQGSAADVMKKAIVDAHKAGLFDELKLHMTVHDELDVSVAKTPAGKEAMEELKQTMEKAVEFDVPLLVDCHTGNNWAEAD
jgi:DNA polymerase I-like protein with 3'-5' exonuclease and polymerase domains